MAARALRVKLSKNGFAGGALGESCALLLLRGKAGRCEAPPGAIADAVNALMEALHFPASATINSQVSAPFSPFSWPSWHVLGMSYETASPPVAVHRTPLRAGRSAAKQGQPTSKAQGLGGSGL